jgi:hypothetical protein
MTVTEGDLAEVMRHEGSVPDNPALACLGTVGEILAYAVAVVRAEKWDEAEEDIAELIVRGTGLSPDKVRKLERELRPLGYIKVCDRLREIAGRRKHELVPLSS